MFQEKLALFLPRSYNDDASDMGTMIVGRFNTNQKIIEDMGIKGVGIRSIGPLPICARGSLPSGVNVTQ